MKKVLITGGTGLIGKQLIEILTEKNIEVNLLTRNNVSLKNANCFLWNPLKGEIDLNALKDVDAIINLAGAGIADKPWTDTRKKEIIESRTAASKVLAEALKKTNHNVKTVINASAIGYYGNLKNKNITEEQSYPYPDFLSDTCKLWETSSHQFEEQNIRTVIIRIGIVLSKEGGALKEMLTPFKFLTGATFSSGYMFTSWIHINDLCSLILFALQNDDVNGVYNAVAPNPVTNKKLTITISKFKHTLIILPVPKLILKLILGERVNMIYQDLHVSNAKIMKTGFKFQFETAEAALKDLLKQ